MKHLRDKYAVVGTGISRLGQVEGITALGLLEEAVKAALDDAGLINADVDGLLIRGPDDVYCLHQLLGARLGINAAFSTTLDNGGASQIMGIALAVMAIDAGMATTVVCAYGRDTWSRTNRGSNNQQKDKRSEPNMIPPSQRPVEHGPEFGFFGPVAMHGLGARRHMFEFGTTREDFAAIAIAFREHACRNPLATMRKPLDLSTYMSARMIVDPFGLYDCSLVSDAAGAVVVTSAERARDLKSRRVLIKGFSTFNNTVGWFLDNNMVTTAAAECSQRAYIAAGLGPSDVDCAQLYDCFTYMVLTQLEDYGFCKKGEGGSLVRSGALSLGGSLPTNTSGGQLSEAHAEGMLQIVEGVRQLQGIYDADRQVKDAEIILVSGHGGNTVCHSTLILGKD